MFTVFLYFLHIKPRHWLYTALNTAKRADWMKMQCGTKKAGGSNRKQAAKGLDQQRKMNCRQVATGPCVKGGVAGYIKCAPDSYRLIIIHKAITESSSESRMPIHTQGAVAVVWFVVFTAGCCCVLLAAWALGNAMAMARPSVCQIDN